MRQDLSEKYDIPVLAMSVESMRESDVLNVLREPLRVSGARSECQSPKLGNGAERKPLAA